MLRITVDLWPGGDEARSRTLGFLSIANVTKLADISDYIYYAKDDKGVEHNGAVMKFERARGFWSLICEVLKDMEDK